MGIFDVNTKGMGLVFSDRAISRMIEELISNSLDENGATDIHVTFRPVSGGIYELVVSDNSPEGFVDMSLVEGP